MATSRSPGDLVASAPGEPTPAGRAEFSGDAEQAVRDLGRRAVLGVLPQAAVMAFVAVRLHDADGLHRGTLWTIFGFCLALRLAGGYLASRQLGTLRLRQVVLAAGALGTFAGWGVMNAAVQVRAGASEPGFVITFAMSGVATGAVTAFAPSRWLHHASLALQFMPAVVLGFMAVGLADPPFAALQLVFSMYMLSLGRSARRDYVQAMRSAELLRRHADSAQLAAATADAMNLQLRAEIAHSSRMEAELRQAQKLEAIGRLVAGIAHEINNPLAYVTGNLEAVAETLQASAKPAPPSEHGELSAAIRDALDGAGRIRKIVQGLLLFSRSHTEPNAPLAVADVLDAAIRLTGNEVRHRAQLVRDYGRVPLVVADGHQLTQVFINLLLNAAHAIPEGSANKNRITVRTHTDDQGSAVIEVEDSGRGIAPDVQARVFDPFFTTKDVGEGTGLGLSICHGIISNLGGQISIASTSGKHGARTVVRVVLPAAAAPVPSPPLATPAIRSARPERRYSLLLVDDEPLVAHTMKRLLRRDYDVTIAECGEEAIEHVTRGGWFDAIVSDVMMPNMTGIDLFEALQRIAPDQARRLIFLSGGAFTEQTVDRLAGLGVPQLEKPVTAEQLRAAVLRIASEAVPQPSTPR